MLCSINSQSKSPLIYVKDDFITSRVNWFYLCVCEYSHGFVEAILCTSATVQSYVVHHRAALYTTNQCCAQGGHDDISCANGL